MSASLAKVTVRTYHGPVVTSQSKNYGIRASITHMLPIVGRKLNDPDVDEVVESFQKLRSCKVNYCNDDHELSLDVFEPSWPDEQTAEHVLKELLSMIVTKKVTSS